MSELDRIRGGASPFDAIRRQRPNGSEFWSARDLQEATEYSRWEDFAKIIDRAMAAAKNSGEDVAQSFAAITEKPAGGGRPRADFELSRFGAYLTVMNGDPNMPRVAEAQHYFAVQTRAAETSRAIDLSDPLAVIEAESARVAKAVEIARGERIRADKAEKKLEIEQRHRHAIEGGDGIDPTTFGKKYFSQVPARKFDDHLYSHGYLINQRNTRIRPDGEIRDGYDHRKPTAKGRKYFYPHDNGTYGGRRRFAARVIPQMEIALRDALAAEGLPVNEHSTGLILLTKEDMKELGA